MQWVTG